MHPAIDGRDKPRILVNLRINERARFSCLELTALYMEGTSPVRSWMEILDGALL